MATPAQIAQIRQNTNEAVNTPPYTDEILTAWLTEANDNVDAVSARLWWAKAAATAHLINVSEAGSTRTMSELHKQYVNMAKMFDERAALFAVTVVNGTRISKAVRI